MDAHNAWPARGLRAAKGLPGALPILLRRQKPTTRDGRRHRPRFLFVPFLSQRGRDATTSPATPARIHSATVQFVRLPVLVPRAFRVGAIGSPQEMDQAHPRRSFPRSPALPVARRAVLIVGSKNRSTGGTRRGRERRGSTIGSS